MEPFVELMNIAESLSLTPDMPAPEPGNPETDLAAATAAATELSEAGIAAQNLAGSAEGARAAMNSKSDPQTDMPAEAETWHAAEAAPKRQEEQDKAKAEEDAKKRQEDEDRKKAEEDARKRQEEEDRKKAEEDARKRQEDEDRKKAEDDARTRQEDEDRKKAEEDARKRQEDEDRKKAEEDARRQGAPRRRGQEEG